MYCRFILVLLPLVMTMFATAQTTGNNCGCDYMPLCNYTAKITYKKLVYYGINGSENRSTYYRCEGGIVTMLWTSESEVHTGTGYDYNPFTRSETTIYYYDTETNYHFEAVLNYNLPVGGKWKVPNTDWEYQVLAKGIDHTYEGKVYNNVIHLRLTRGTKMNYEDFLTNVYAEGKDDVYYEGRSINASQDKYWAKGVGFLNSKNTYDTVFRMLKSKKVSKDFNKQRMIARLDAVYVNKAESKRNESVLYVGIDRKNGVMFLEAISGGGSQSSNIYLTAHEATLEIGDNMYVENFDLIDDKGKRWKANFPGNKKLTLDGTPYHSSISFDIHTFYPKMSFPGNFSVHEFNAKNKGMVKDYSRIDNLSKDEMIAIIKKEYENKESYFRNDKDEDLIGIWVSPTGTSNQANKPGSFQAFYFFKDGTYKETLYRASQKNMVILAEGRWYAAGKRIRMLTSLERQTTEIMSNIGKPLGPKFINDVRAMVGSKGMNYKIVLNKRTGKATLTLIGDSAPMEPGIKRMLEKVSEKELKRMQ